MSKNPYLDDRLRSEKGTNFLGFIDNLQKLWELAGKDGRIIRNYTKDDLENTPVITYKIKSRTPHPSFREKKPRYRDIIEHPYRPGEYVQIYGQVQQVFVNFVIYSVSDEEADRITIELEEFIEEYKAFFKSQGVKEIYFHEQEEDENYSEFNVPLAKRSIIFDMQFEKIGIKYLNQIEQLAVQAEIYHNDQNNEEELQW